MGVFMKDKLYLHIPSFEELEYKRKIMAQPDTMSYNRGYELKCYDYNNETGCFDFKKEYWKDWYTTWISNEPKRFYAYLSLVESGEFIGDVCFHYQKSSNSHCIGIVLEAKHRGKGYCAEGLIRLAEKAFIDLNIDKLRNEIPAERESAIAGHKKAGFKEIEIVDGICILELAKGDFLNSIKGGYNGDSI